MNSCLVVFSRGCRFLRGGAESSNEWYKFRWTTRRRDKEKKARYEELEQIPARIAVTSTPKERGSIEIS